MSLTFSRLTLGTVQFGLPYGIANQKGQPEFHEVLEILACAHEAGITSLDTAALYGTSEAILGRALEELDIASEMLVVTKIRHLPQGITKTEAQQHIRSSVENSLRSLRLQSLPLCLFHREEDFQYVDILLELRAQGLVREIGASVMTPGNTTEILNTHFAEAIQVPANLLDHRFRTQGILRQAQQQKVAVFVRSIYLQGLLLMPQAGMPVPLQKVVPIRLQLEALAREAGLTLTELAARYIWTLPEVSSIVFGVDSVAQLRQNIAIFGQGNLTPDLKRAIEEIVPTLPDTILNPFLWPHRAL